jgi:hypothetical protein
VSLVRKQSVFEAVASSTLCLCENWVSIWKVSKLQLRCFKVEIGSVCSKKIFSWDEETHLSLNSKPPMLEAATSTTLFPCGNWVRFSMEYVLLREFPRQRYGLVFQIGLYRDNETHVFLLTIPFVFETVACTTLFPYENCLNFWKENFRKSYFWTLRKAHFVPKRPNLLRRRNTCNSRKKTIMLEAGASNTCFPF